MAFSASVFCVSFAFAVAVVLFATAVEALVAGGSGTNATTAANTTVTVLHGGHAETLSKAVMILVAGGTNATATANATVTARRGGRPSPLSTASATLVAGGTSATATANTTVTARRGGRAARASTASMTLVAGGTNATATTNTTVTARRGGRASPLSEEQQYICYLCRGRNPLMLRWCPLDLDECHIACLSSPSASRSSSPPALATPADADRSSDDCYVMKLYPDGSWVIVDVVSCQASGGCFLACSHGELRFEDAAGRGTTPAAAFSPLPNGLADFERCGDQLVAPRVTVPGV